MEYGDKAQQRNPGFCAVVELRQYSLKPGQRDVLIDLFDRHFIESQEADGMTIVGQFRDRRRADRFVWVRGFADMQTRHAALERFYTGPVWTRHRAAANATMIDFNDVWLLNQRRRTQHFVSTQTAVLPWMRNVKRHRSLSGFIHCACQQTPTSFRVSAATSFPRCNANM
jgi:NIPSNAP protein